ncbi:enoyl-CoA hydratase-related protein [Ilumatobacter sp.]|uniref:enoyl-CoA hydratase-related protein n=1 Tax=Ilumatobacter sp. TaxID=1967498 RepID=UPI003B52E0CC
MPELVRTTIADDVATLTLDSQPNRNALSRQLVSELHAGLDAAEDAEVRAIVVGAVGPAFCAGADLKERSDGPPDSEPFARVMTRLMDTPRPTIAAVGGAVRAGGIGLMASCDLVVVRRDVSFALTEVRIGVAAAMISVPILRRVPPAKIAAALLTGEPFDADEALSMGLVSHVTDDVDAQVAELVSGVRAGARRAVAETKAMLALVPTLDRDAAMGAMTELSTELFSGPDAVEGMAAFREKRLPAWNPDA